MTIFRNIILALALSSCSAYGPKPFVIEEVTPDIAQNSPDFQQGWMDGCESGKAVFSNAFYKMFYGYKRNPEKVGNQSYETAWYAGYNYCRHYTRRWLKDDF